MPYGTFIFFGAFSFLGGLFIWFLVRSQFSGRGKIGTLNLSLSH